MAIVMNLAREAGKSLQTSLKSEIKFLDLNYKPKPKNGMAMPISKKHNNQIK